MAPFALPYPEIDPAIFTLEFGSFTFALRWYALAYIAGLVLGWRLIVYLMRRPRLWPADRAPLTPEQPEELLTWMTLGVILGGRLGYVLFYNPGYYLSNPAEIPAIWQGGMSFHGGFLGVVVGVALFARRKGAPVLQIGDAVALAAPAGLFFGRIANFINSELWGRTTEMPWGMVFPNGGPMPRHPSQLYEAALEGLLLGAVMWGLALGAGWLKRSGAMIGLFLLGYGLARTVVENFRQADAEFITLGNQMGHVIRFGTDWGLTMGQVLSLPMAAIGLAVLVIVFVRRRASPA